MADVRASKPPHVQSHKIVGTIPSLAPDVSINAMGNYISGKVPSECFDESVTCCLSLQRGTSQSTCNEDEGTIGSGGQSYQSFARYEVQKNRPGFLPVS